MTRRSWFLAPRAPNFDCSPTGYLALGSIISDPFEPDNPIASGIPEPLPEDIKVERHWRKDWETVNERRRQGRMSVWARFVDLLQSDIGVNWESAHLNAYRFEKLEINWFSPPRNLLKDRMSGDEVAEFTKQGTFRPKVFIITAVMIARNPAVKQSTDGSWGITLGANVNLASAGVAGVSVGADHAVSDARHNETSAASSSDFVYAYRLSQVIYGESQLPKSKSYSKGAVFADEPRLSERNVPIVDLDDLDILDVVAGEHAFDSVLSVDELADTEEECDCIIV